MSNNIVFIERKFWQFVSIEKVFRQIASSLNQDEYNFKFVKLKHKNNLMGLVKNIFTFKKPKAEVLHITGHIHYISLKLPANKTLLTIHDLGFLHNNKGFKRYVLKKLYLDLPVKKLKYITTISNATRDEIVFHTNCDINKIRVIENPLPDQFRLKKKKHFNSDYPLILQVGTSKNKNLENLVAAIEKIDCRLEIIGRLSDQQKDYLEDKGIDYLNSYDLSDTEMFSKYEKADLVAFCSTFEGFGLPIIESQAMKTPVVTSNISPLKEVAGNGAVLVDPTSVDSIREGIKKVIADEILRNKIVEGGLENIKRFEPKVIAQKYEKVYEEILSNS